MKKTILVFLTLVIMLYSCMLNAQIIYVTTDQGNIYSVDMATCTKNLISASGIYWGDLAMCSGDPNTLYAPDPTGNLYQIDVATGVQTLINNQFSTQWPTADLYSLACDGNGILYGSSDNVAGLYSFNLSTGTWTFLSNLNGFLAGGDLTFYNGELYMSTTGNQLIKIDLSTYNTTVVSNLSVSNMYGILTTANGMACNPSSYTMLGFAASSIYTIDVNTGNATTTCSNIVPGEELEGAASISEGLVNPQIMLTKGTINVKCNGACDGQAIALPNSGTVPYVYSWTGGCITATCTNLCPGKYIINITDSVGCTGVDSIVITEPQVLAGAITSVTPASCNGDCDGSALATASGGTPNFTYSWNTVPVQNSAAVVGLCEGNYTCTVTDSNNCVTTIVDTITEPPPVVIDPIPDASVCAGSNTVITASASGGNPGGYNFSWDAPGNPGFANTASVTVNPVGMTTYTVNVNDIANNCPAIPVTVTVSINPLPTANAGSTQYVCPGMGITLAGSIGGAATSGKWDGGTGTYSPNDSTLNAVYTPSADEYAADSVTLTLTTNDPPGSCTPSSSNVTFYFYKSPVIIFTVGDSAGCPVFCTDFTNSTFIGGGDSIVEWNWNFGDGSNGSSIQNPSYCFSTSGFYDITLTAISNHGCSISLTKTHFIEVFNIPDAAFNPSPNPSTVLDPIVTMNNQSSSDVNYWHWDFGDGLTLAPNFSSPAHTYPNATSGSYIATLIVQNADGCYDTVAHEIFIGPEFTFFIPNSFTPNGDGINDFFFGAGVGISKYQLWIFDRWGNLIFDCNVNDLPQSQPCRWNGVVQPGGPDFSGNSGGISQIDVYVWKVSLTDVFYNEHNYIGTVTIVK